MTAAEKILALFEQNTDWSVVELTREIGVSKQLVHRIVKSLVDKGTIQKLGLPPKTIYRKTAYSAPISSVNPFSKADSIYLQNNFLAISETGEYLEGYNGFDQWCIKRKLPVQKTFDEFKKTRQKYQHYYTTAGIINGMPKIKQTKGFEDIYLDELYYLDFYAIERFGKTKLGTILHFAKQGQNKFLMRILLDQIKTRIEEFIAKHKIKALGFVPPTIKRELQLMHFLKTGIDITIPLINIQKIHGKIPIPQKSLSSLAERINNADTTFTIPEEQHYSKILLIDDAMGSGATLNQIAKKIKEKGTSNFIIGLAIVGSFKGFDVITDV